MFGSQWVLWPPVASMQLWHFCSCPFQYGVSGLESAQDKQSDSSCFLPSGHAEHFWVSVSQKGLLSSASVQVLQILESPSGVSSSGHSVTQSLIDGFQ